MLEVISVLHWGAVLLQSKTIFYRKGNVRKGIRG